MGILSMPKTAFTITSVADWQTKMQAAFVMTEADVKSQTILADAQAKTAAAGLELIPDDGLLAEVTGLVEWPNAILGTIDDSFSFAGRGAYHLDARPSEIFCDTLCLW